jgi:hypothetical protein
MVRQERSVIKLRHYYTKSRCPENANFLRSMSRACRRHLTTALEVTQAPHHSDLFRELRSILFRFAFSLDVEFMNEPMKYRCKHDANAGEKRHATENGVAAGKEFSRIGM